MTFLQDLRAAWRAMLKAPAFSLATIVTLALGLTLCTTAMAVMKAYLVRDLPYPAAERLYSVRYGAPGQPLPRDMETLDWESLGDILEHRIAWDLDAFYLLGGEYTEMVLGAWVTPGFIQGLGIQPALGRGLESHAFLEGAENVVLISHRLWISRFGGDPGVLGRQFTAYVSDRPQEAERFTIAGVLPAGFWHLNMYTEILAPLRAPSYPYLVRLRPGVTPQQAATRIAALVRAGGREVPPDWVPEVISTHEEYVGRTRPLLWTASAAAALVLLVACANVAALLLVRAVRRQREVAVRIALGARGTAIARMLLAEAVVLCAAATLLALTGSSLALGWLAPLVQQQLGRRAPGGVEAFALDGGTLAVAVGIGALTAGICALAPLVVSRRLGIREALQSGGRAATEGVGSRRLRATLIAMELAVSLTLLVASFLMVRSMLAVLRTDFGFRAERVLMASVTLRQPRYPDREARVALFDRMESSLAGIPGVDAVGLTSAWPVQQPRELRLEMPGASASSLRVAVHRINGSYFRALGIPLVAGRHFTSADRLGSEPVVLLSATLASQLWADGSAVGRRLVLEDDLERPEPLRVERLVIGVVADVRQGPSDQDLADAYVPLLQSPGRFLFVLTRTHGNPLDALPALRSTFRGIDPELAAQGGRPLQVIVDELAARPRFLASLLGLFAAVAGVLALVGVYGAIAYTVRQREREIAVRIALGAAPAQVVRLFLRQGAVILAAGLALGVLGAAGAGRVLQSLLFGVSPGDPAVFAVAVAVFAGAGFAAVWWPSRRAATTDPAEALRVE